ncbi:hypothetical protein GCM10009624_30790 [Gordonia sinesedis]
MIESDASAGLPSPQISSTALVAQSILGVLLVALLFFGPPLVEYRVNRQLAASCVIGAGVLLALIAPRSHRDWGFVIALAGATMIPVPA